MVKTSKHGIKEYDLDEIQIMFKKDIERAMMFVRLGMGHGRGKDRLSYDAPDCDDEMMKKAEKLIEEMIGKDREDSLVWNGLFFHFGMCAEMDNRSEKWIYDHVVNYIELADYEDRLGCKVSDRYLCSRCLRRRLGYIGSCECYPEDLRAKCDAEEKEEIKNQQEEEKKYIEKNKKKGEKHE